MPGALLGATRCGRCSHERAVNEADRMCPACGAPWVSAAPASLTATAYGPLSGVAPATRGRRYAAHVIDLVVLAVPAALAAAVALGFVTAGVPWWLLAVVALFVLVAQTIVVAARGRSLGRLLLRLRTVDDLTGTPVGFGRLLRRIGRSGWSRSLVTVDLRRGRDPDVIRAVVPELDPAAADIKTARPAADTGQPADGAGRASVGIVLDSGERYEIHRALLLGRNPADPSGSGEAALLAWPDMSRRLAKTHVLLEWSGTVLWVTDLQTATGTALVSRAGERQPVTPGVRTAAAIGTSIECGGRSLKVVPSG